MHIDMNVATIEKQINDKFMESLNVGTVYCVCLDYFILASYIKY